MCRIFSPRITASPSFVIGEFGAKGGNRRVARQFIAAVPFWQTLFSRHRGGELSWSGGIEKAIFRLASLTSACGLSTSHLTSSRCQPGSVASRALPCIFRSLFFAFRLPAARIVFEQSIRPAPCVLLASARSRSACLRAFATVACLNAAPNADSLVAPTNNASFSKPAATHHTRRRRVFLLVFRCEQSLFPRTSPLSLIPSVQLHTGSLRAFR
ncbi:hypothetical protein L596_003584 [Steinernema carpocapsae]|uniref:Uncharacterized protein n=1 Tax=Steinernema carpocapsae TaxID=34508 RepID=A0A4U8UT30_STECR|nr:hypothetical protein L596_003584 [Steinernema carpocapsae]